LQSSPRLSCSPRQHRARPPPIGRITDGSPNGYDRDCFWYAGSAQCSGWNYWSANQVTVYSGGPTLNGFENYSTIRGHWTYAGQYNSIAPSDLGMPRYVRAQETNFSGLTAWVSVWAIA
jgi:hypothetical protein